ncbi:16S rRNA processing protein RimM [Sulfitobacter albidus]|uniref:Ribosome maturation factor RimM n=1 Tax=Sulfitobacter albidus TaxID=2829501 RepID=A0A975PM29_9RHOB|nr:ribosome maturation factor RimM [Sulfitobacter albidus]QUJ75800.1 16S rRNA processing protein RimM [Sulfitobacter albidus]
MSAERICVGAIAGAYGVRGELRVKSFCAVPEDLETYKPLTTEDGSRQFSLALIRPIKNGFSARIAEITTKEDADALRGTQLYASRDQLPSLPDDEFYHADLIGLEVTDTGGTLLGRVKTVQNHGADDLLELQLVGGSATVFLPFTKAAVPTVDLTAGRIVADPPEGLLPDRRDAEAE